MSGTKDNHLSLPRLEELTSLSLGKNSPFQTDIIDKARTKFAICATKGIEYLIRHKLLDNTARDIADFLLHCSFLDRTQIGEYLSDLCTFVITLMFCSQNGEVLLHYLGSIPVAGLNLVIALRRFLKKFKLPGEAQKIDRLMEAFAVHYCKYNPKVFQGSDTAYILSFSIILLNTDLHNPHNPNRMTREIFMTNVRGIDNGRDLPVELLSEIYDAIAKQELMNEQEELLEYTLSAPDIEGTLWKKSDRSNFYSWNRRWCVVVNGCLYYFYGRKDRNPRGVIPLEDLTVRPLNRKGKFRFEITASDWGSGELRINDDNAGEMSVQSGSIHTQTTINSHFALSIDGHVESSGASIRSTKSSRLLSLPLIKSAKFVKGQLVEGKRNCYVFQCANEEERDRWVAALNGRMQRCSPQITSENEPQS